MFKVTQINGQRRYQKRHSERKYIFHEEYGNKTKYSKRVKRSAGEDNYPENNDKAETESDSFSYDGNSSTFAGYYHPHFGDIMIAKDTAKLVKEM